MGIENELTAICRIRNKVSFKAIKNQGKTNAALWFLCESEKKNFDVI
jgi:hypothetical protein